MLIFCLFYNLQAQDHLLGVILKTPSADYKQYIVLVLTPELPSNLKTPSDSRDTKGTDFQVLVPKAKRGLEDDYYSSVTSRKGSGTVNITLPHHGVAAGVNYEVRGVVNNEFLSICNRKIRIDQARLLDDVSAGAYSNTVQQLLTLKSDGNKYPPALDPVKGMNVNYFAFISFSVRYLTRIRWATTIWCWIYLQAILGTIFIAAVLWLKPTETIFIRCSHNC